MANKIHSVFGKNPSTFNNIHMRSEFKKFQQIHHRQHTHKKKLSNNRLRSSIFSDFLCRVHFCSHRSTHRLFKPRTSYIPIYSFFVPLNFFFFVVIVVEQLKVIFLLIFGPNYLLSIFTWIFSWHCFTNAKCTKFSPLKSGKCREKECKRIKKTRMKNKNCLLYVFTWLSIASKFKMEYFVVSLFAFASIFFLFCRFCVWGFSFIASSFVWYGVFFVYVIVVQSSSFISFSTYNIGVLLIL